MHHIKFALKYSYACNLHQVSASPPMATDGHWWHGGRNVENHRNKPIKFYI